MSDAGKILDRLKSSPITVEPNPRPTCGTCPHWRSGDDQRWGNCTCSLPEIVPALGTITGQWPQTTALHGCGQHPDMPNWIKTEWQKVKANAI